MYVITGASGNIGKVLAMELLSKGKQVRAIARHPDKLQALADKGAELAIGDIKDPSFVKKAFKGATACYCMIPGDLHSDDLTRDQHHKVNNLFEAVKANNVKYVVLLSSVGAHLREGAGVVDGLGYMEHKFDELKDTNIKILRPSYFMENLFGQIGTIKQMGIIGAPLKSDLKLPMVATKDIAKVAFEHLNSLDFKGNTIEYILGPRDITYNEVAAVLGKAIGKPDLKYVQFSYDEARKSMVQSGFISENVARLFNGLSEAMNNGKALNFHVRTDENSSPTSIEEFASTFVQVYNMPATENFTM